MRWIAAAIVLCMLATDLRGQELSNGISVAGFGIARGRPVVVELSASVSAEAELAVDASVKLRDARQRAIDALEKLSNLSVSVESRGFIVNPAVDPALLAQGRQLQQVVVNGNLVLQEMRPADLARKTSMVEQVRITLKDADGLWRNPDQRAAGGAVRVAQMIVHCGWGRGKVVECRALL